MKISNQQSLFQENESYQKHTNQTNKMDSSVNQETTHSLPSIHNNVKENVIVALSEDALTFLKNSDFQIEKGHLNETYKEQMVERNKLLKKYIKRDYTNGIIIPNIRTHAKFTEGLEGADRSIYIAANAIIQSDLLQNDVGDMSEEERKGLIALGLEKAKYLAGKLDDKHASLFMEAMETVAKYGINGKKADDGRVKFDIEEGPRVGAPLEYIGTYELMKIVSPEAYEEYKAMDTEATKKKDKELASKAFKFTINWIKYSAKHLSQEIDTVIANRVAKFKSWESKINSTVVYSEYKNTDISNKEAFSESISRQNTVLDKDYLKESLESFSELVGETVEL